MSAPEKPQTKPSHAYPTPREHPMREGFYQCGGCGIPDDEHPEQPGVGQQMGPWPCEGWDWVVR